MNWVCAFVNQDFCINVWIGPGKVPEGWILTSSCGAWLVPMSGAEDATESTRWVFYLAVSYHQLVDVDSTLPNSLPPSPELSSLQAVMESWANMWMKLFSAFLALLLYLWTLCFMRFCFSRSLIQTPLNPATHWVSKEPENNHSKKKKPKSSPLRV